MAGPQHSEIGFLISTDIASWRGPNTEAGGKSAYNNVQVGGATNSEAGGKSASMNIIKKLGNKMLPNFIFKIINPI
ncbi:hypothetical protein [Staphylococcus aureus]|uniref:hypothetical protein n=1 Tax=Staphylococcus aureus TaxID=1280 RepID=UPI0030F48398